MFKEFGVLHNMAVLLLAVLLVLPVLAACDDDDDEKNVMATESMETTSPATSPETTTTPSSVAITDPVKIGVISPWSGPMGMAGIVVDQAIEVVEQQLKDMGGILGGRQVEFVRGDCRGETVHAVAQARRLALEEKVDILTVGGAGGASMNAVATEAEALQVPYVSISTIFGGTEMNYNCSITSAASSSLRWHNFPIDFVKPESIAFLSYDDESVRNGMNSTVEGIPSTRSAWEDVGIDIVYEEYSPLATVDFSPYITKIKYENPDLVMILPNTESQAIQINRQVMELGGWGDSKVWFAASAAASERVVSMPEMLGAYVAVEWMAGSDEPGMKTFEEAYKKVHGRSPSSMNTYHYNTFWTAIEAIKLAGTTDHDEVAKAIRSGNLEWDSAWGPLRISEDGIAMPILGVAQVQEGGKLVKVWESVPY